MLQEMHKYHITCQKALINPHCFPSESSMKNTQVMFFYSQTNHPHKAEFLLGRIISTEVCEMEYFLEVLDSPLYLTKRIVYKADELNIAALSG
jgi:hypothetical protein